VHETEPLVEILAVEPVEPDGSVLRGIALARPQPGDPSADYAGTFGFDVSGWVLGARLPARRVSLVLDGTPIWEVPVDREWGGVAEDYPDAPGAARSGFQASLSSLPLPYEFRLRMDAVLSDGDRTARPQVATIRGRRARLHSGYDPRFQPLMVTGFSRTGSNLVLRLLGAHPQIVAYRPFYHEPRVSHYWVDVLRELTEPGSSRRQIAPRSNLAQRGWWLDAPRQAPRLDEVDVERRIAAEAVPRIASFCQERIDAAYTQLAQPAGRSDATYFAEKHLPMHVPTMLWDLYPRAREVFLVRDFRDMVSSMFRADAKWGGRPRFGRAGAASDQHFVQNLRHFARDLEGSWRRRRGTAHLVRYEDLILAPEQTVAGLIAYLGVEDSPSANRAMVTSLNLRDEGSEIYRTTPSPRESIGRWRSDLSPAVREECDRVFAPVLELFGYET
jgi:hypothetical protein